MFGYSGALARQQVPAGSEDVDVEDLYGGESSSLDEDLGITGRSRRNSVASRAPLQRHEADCELCVERIKGERWMCLECGGWSLCDSCFHNVSNEVHPLHTFVRVRSTGDVYAPPAKASETPIVHLDVLCSSCQRPILGVRYECIADECRRLFNLCQSCEALPLQAHKTSHPMVKYRVPKERAASAFLLGRSLEDEKKEQESFVRKNQPVEKSNKGLWELSDKVLTTEALLHARRELCMEIEFDKETPWGSRVAPGATFARSWDVTNTGSLPWPKGTTVSLISPAKFSPSYFRKRVVSDDVVVVQSSVEIRFLDLQAPQEGGTHVEVWALSDPKGRLFGERLEIRIFVGEEDKHASNRYFGLDDAMKGVEEGKEDLERQRVGAVGREPCKMLLLSSQLLWRYEEQRLDLSWIIRNIGGMSFPKKCQLRRLHRAKDAMLPIDVSSASISVPERLGPNQEGTIGVSNIKLLPSGSTPDTPGNGNDTSDDTNDEDDDDAVKSLLSPSTMQDSSSENKVADDDVGGDAGNARDAVAESAWFADVWVLVDSEGTEFGQQLSLDQKFLCISVQEDGGTKKRLVPQVTSEAPDSSEANPSEVGKRRTIKSYGDNHTIERF